MRSKKYEESGYSLNLDSVTISYKIIAVSYPYPRRSGLVRKNN
jgi:hypothetical protein